VNILRILSPENGKKERPNKMLKNLSKSRESTRIVFCNKSNIA